jgi:hypothetical protein
MAASKNRHSRRRLLQGLTASALAYPFVRALPSSAADHPKRLLFFYSPNSSMDRDYWKPAGDGAEIALPDELPPMLEPLNGFQDNLLVIGNMHMTTRDKETGPGGHVGMGHQLTGWANRPWPNQTMESDFWAGGISLDQFVANELGTQALTLAARPYGNTGGSRISYLGADQPVDPHEDPAAVFSTLFGNPDLSENEQLAESERQIRVMDRTAAELDKLKGRLPQEDRTKLEIHLEHLLKLENDLKAFNPAACNPTAPEGGYNWDSGSDYPITSRRHMDVLATAVACGITRIGSIQNGNTGNAEAYNGVTEWPSEDIYIDRSQHVVAHDFELEPDNPTYIADRLTIERLYVRQYAYLLEKLRSIPEGDGTVLDNTLVVWTKGMGRGHSKDRLLYLVAGGSGFPDLKPGRYIDRDGVPHNNLLVTLANLMGVEIDTFGDPEICSGAMEL